MGYDGRKGVYEDDRQSIETRGTQVPKRSARDGPVFVQVLGLMLCRGSATFLAPTIGDSPLTGLTCNCWTLEVEGPYCIPRAEEYRWKFEIGSKGRIETAVATFMGAYCLWLSEKIYEGRWKPISAERVKGSIRRQINSSRTSAGRARALETRSRNEACFGRYPSLG